MNAQAVYLFFTNCSAAPPRVTALYFGYIVSLFILFLQFFLTAYAKPAGTRAAKAD